MQDHGEWEPRGDRLVSKRGQLISVDRNRRIYYRNIDIGTRYTNSNYEKLLRFENDLEVQKKLCKKSPKLLNFASEAVQLAAVRQNGYAIQHIRDPSEAVQLAAVRQNGYVIRFIQNPSEAVKLSAVRQNGWAIQFIKNPSEEVKRAAVQQDGSVIRYIDNPSED